MLVTLVGLSIIFITILIIGVKIMSLLDDLEAKVTEVSTVEDSVVTLLGEAVTLLKEARDSPDNVRLNQLIRALDARKEKLAAAVVANTLPPASPPENTDEPEGDDADHGDDDPSTDGTDVETPTDVKGEGSNN